MRSPVLKHRLSTGARCALGVALSATLALGSVPALAFADPQSELASARSELERIGSEYNSLQAALDQAGRDLEETKGAIEENEQAIAEKQEELEAAQLTLSDRVSDTYKTGDVDFLEVVLGATDFNDLLSRILYADKVVDADKQAIDEVKRIQEELDQKQAELEETQEAQQQLVDDTNAQLGQLAASQQEAADLVNSLDAEVQAQLQAEADSNDSLSNGIQAAGDNGSSNTTVTGGGSSNNGGGSNSGSGGSSSKPSLPEASGGSAISVALQYQGAPYVYGGDSPSDGGFDCSGLVYYAYKQAYGITLPRGASSQAAYIKSHGTWTTNIDELQYGDLVFFTGHVAFYVGNGNCYGARTPGVGAGTSAMKYFPGFYGGGHL